MRPADVDDWRSYDGIADRYDPIWSARFAAVARAFRALLAPDRADRVLDIGTGTGVVLRTLVEGSVAPGFMAGIDRSAAMLRRARSQLTGMRVLAGDAAALPFRDRSFDIVTAGFVLSHVPDYPRTLAESRRVLAPGGRIAVSNWAASSDPYGTAWNDRLAAAISQPEIERAMAEVAPCEGHLSQDGALEAALAEAGFADVRVETVDVESDLTVEQFLEDRALTAPARLAARRLGPDGWARLLSAARDAFHARFGPSFRYSRQALMATGRQVD
jgi:ubiquinone/menaquinone biosynthesis C-methylase UbiE